MENGEECYCGNKFPVKPKLVADAKCDMPCNGNKTEICGGKLLISVYFGKTNMDRIRMSNFIINFV